MYIICRRDGYFILLLFVTGLAPLYFLFFTNFAYYTCILFSTYDILVAEEVGIIPGLNAWASTSFNFVL